MTASIIIPVFNQWQLTKACLESIKENTDNSVEVIIVDNGSYDETKENIPSWVKTITLERNFGFNIACRAGVAASKHELIVLLNNDTVVTEGWLSELVKALSLSNVGIVGPKLVTADGQLIQHGGYAYNREMSVFFPLYQGLDRLNPLVNRMRDLPALLGACLLFRRTHYEQVGGLAEYALEDIDLCLKFRELGLRTLLASKSVVLHHSSATFRLSNDSEIPKTKQEPFFQYWTKEKLGSLVSDKEIFKQDGIELISVQNDNIKVKEIADDILELWKQPHSKEVLHNILSLHSGFLPALHELDSFDLFLNYIRDYPDDRDTMAYMIDRWGSIENKRLDNVKKDLEILSK